MIDTLFDEIAFLIPKLQGWCTVPKAQLLAAAVVNSAPELSCIIGVWAGRDAFALALAHKAVGRGRVLAIDPWSAEASKEGQTGEHLAWWSKPEPHEMIYREFLKKRKELGLEDIIEVRRMPSDTVEVPSIIDGPLVLDGNHGPATIRDSQRFGPNVKRGTICLLDDLDWQGGFVLKARGHLVNIGFRPLYKIDTSEVFRKV